MTIPNDLADAGPLRLLVVDDDDVDRLSVRRALSRGALVADVTEAADAAGALALLPPGAPFDAVLLDYQIAGDTALDVLAALAARGAEVPVVVLTGHADAETAARLLKAGALDFLVKDGLTPQGLEQAVRGAVRAARAQRELRDQREALEQQAAELEQQFEEAQALSEELSEANERLRAATRAAEAADAARREEAEIVETLNRVGAVLARELDHERIVQTVTDEATQLTRAQFGAFFYNVLNDRGESYTLYTISGVPREAFSKFPMPRNTHVFEPTFRGEPAGGVVRSDDITKDPRYGHMAPHHGMPPGHLPVRSYLATSVISRQGEVIGGLFFGHAEPGVFTERAERLAAGIASWASVALDNARLLQTAERARAAAEAANEAKSEFLANMSHELRTPLNAIGGYADLLLEEIRGPIVPPQRADLERIKRSQRHLLGLINDILNFAKIEAGRVRFALRDVSMNEAIGELEALIAPQLREKRLRYEYHCCDPRFTAHVDPERLQQIFLNLLSNAAKFTPPGGSIRVDCDATADAMVVDVTDTGVGIPPEKLESIFEPFVQLDRGQSPGQAGTGLGLAISRDLARAMGGDLTVRSAIDRGSTFRLTLPRRPAA